MRCTVDKTSRTPTASITDNLEDVRHPEHRGVLRFLHKVVRHDLDRRLREFQRRLHADLQIRSGMVFHGTRTNVGRLAEIAYGQIPAVERLRHDVVAGEGYFSVLPQVRGWEQVFKTIGWHPRVELPGVLSANKFYN